MASLLDLDVMTHNVMLDVRRQVCEAQENGRLKGDALPFITLTYAQIIDGSLAAERGKLTLLSGPTSMKMTHMLRTLHDGILVGVGTVIADNPSLNARLAEGKNPRPIIIDTGLRCPTTIKLFTLPRCEKPIILFGRGSEDPDIVKRKQALEALGAQVLECQTVRGEDGRDHVNLGDAFRVAKQNGLNSIMVEGGAAILTSCLQEASQRHFIDLVVVTIAPTFIGGLRAVSTLLAPSTSPPAPHSLLRPSRRPGDHWSPRPLTTPTSCPTAEALDAAGQVYVFGKGAYQRFDSDPREPDFVEFMEYGVVRELWEQRVCPPTAVPSANDSKSPIGSAARSGSQSAGATSTGGKGDDNSSSSKNHIHGGSRPSPSRMKLETSTRAFANRQTSKVTAFLWGKRVHQVACGAAIAYALTASGEVFCWGGNKRQWKYFYDEATAPDGFSNSTPSATLGSDGNGMTRSSGSLHRLLTARSEMLRLFALPSQVTESQEIHDKLGLRQKYAKVFERPPPLSLTDEDRRRRLELVGRYYGLLDPIPGVFAAPVR